jgi:hypothetical protein
MPSRLQSRLRIYLPSTGCLQSNFSMEFHHYFLLFPIHSTVYTYFCTCTDPSLNCVRQIRRNTNRRVVSNLSAEVRVRSQASPCRSFGGQNGTETCLSQSTLGFPLSAFFYQCSLFFISSITDAMAE